jgi:hypothetical protein
MQTIEIRRTKRHISRNTTPSKIENIPKRETWLETVNIGGLVAQPVKTREEKPSEQTFGAPYRTNEVEVFHARAVRQTMTNFGMQHHGDY